MTRRSSTSGPPPRLRRRTRTIAALLVAALVASSALVTATTGSAGAVPIQLIVSGDAVSRNPQPDPDPDGPWTYGSNYFQGIEDLAEGQAFGGATFRFVDKIFAVEQVTDEALVGVDVYISSAVAGGYSAAEKAALLRFVERGGVLIALSNDNSHNVTDFLGATLGPDSMGAAVANSDPAATLLPDRPAQVDLYLTRSYFTALPPGAVPLYREGVNPVVALIPFGTIGRGAVLLASDSDLLAGGSSEQGTPLPTANRNFAVSLFNYIGQAFSTTPSLQYPTYVNAAYYALLARGSDPAGNAYWSNLLANGMPRSAFAFEIAKQAEWVDRVVGGLYQDVFGRAPDAGGLAYWRGLIQNGVRVSSVAAELYGSPEFFAVQGGGTNEGWVTAMYQRILGRAPDSAGLTYWAGQIASGVPATSLANALYLSVESNARRVQTLYMGILNRAPDAAGLQYWANQLFTLDDIALAAELVASEEFFTRALTHELPAVT